MHKELAENIEKMEDMTYGDGEIEEKEEERSCEFSYRCSLLRIHINIFSTFFQFMLFAPSFLYFYPKKHMTYDKM